MRVKNEQKFKLTSKKDFGGFKNTDIMLFKKIFITLHYVSFFKTTKTNYLTKLPKQTEK